MKIGILVCDHIKSEMQAQFGNYPAMFSRLFKRVDPALEFVVYNVVDMELPDKDDQCDAYIISGSKHSVLENQTWMLSVETLIRQWHKNKKPVIGICFGHQLLAKALGGRVEKSTKGWGIGVASTRILNQPSWINTTDRFLNIIVNHQDQVVKLPEDAVIIAGNDFCPYFMIQINHSIGIQGHPEFCPDFARKLLELQSEQIDSLLIEEAMNSLENTVHADLLTTWLVHYLYQIKADRSALS